MGNDVYVNTLPTNSSDNKKLSYNYNNRNNKITIDFHWNFTLCFMRRSIERHQDFWRFLSEHICKHKINFVEILLNKYQEITHEEIVSRPCFSFFLSNIRNRRIVLWADDCHAYWEMEIDAVIFFSLAFRVAFSFESPRNWSVWSRLIHLSEKKLPNLWSY